MTMNNIQYDPFDRVVNQIVKNKAKNKLRQIEGLTFQNASHGFQRIAKEIINTDKLSFDDDTKEKIRQLIYYFMNDEKCEFDLTKGLFLYGNTGTGKTTLLRCFSAFTRVTRLKEFKIVSAKKIVNDVLSEGNASSLSKYSVVADQIDYGFDDVGHENECNIYGTKVNCLEEILTARYDRKLLTHCTSNLIPDKVKSFYGQRLYSRLYEMFNIIQVKGKDHRIT